MAGSELPVRLGLYIPMEAGKPDFRHVMVSMTDVTELLDTQERLESLIVWKDQFTASVAHELRTPVTGIVGFSEVLASGISSLDEDSVVEIVGLLAGEARELERLVEDLLVASRGEASQLEIHSNVVELKPLVEEAIRVVDADTPLGGADVRAYADRVRVRQIVRNLLTNAIRYGGPDRRIETGTSNGMAYVDVLDNGDPIPEDSVDKIFEPFSRGTGKKVATSVGLGLSVARSLAHAQGGTLVHFRVGADNVFRLTLPMR